MSQFAASGAPISLTGVSEARAGQVRDFARSELFARTFSEGMELVEETAAYLDGEGRREAKLLSRAAALAYASESMGLTTRLMQIASWLLVQRAVREGDGAAQQLGLAAAFAVQIGGGLLDQGHSVLEGAFKEFGPREVRDLSGAGLRCGGAGGRSA